jgi:mRNA interferase MazF
MALRLSAEMTAMNRMNRGDIHWIDIPTRLPPGSEIIKPRPCVIISATAINTSKRRTVVAIPLTTNNKVYPPFSIAVRSAGETSVAVCDQIFAVDKSRIRDFVGSVSVEDMEGIENCLGVVLGM